MRYKVALFILFLFLVSGPAASLTAQEARQPTKADLARAVMTREGLSQIFGRPFHEGSSEHYRCWSDDSADFSNTLTAQCEKSVVELGKVLEDDALFGLVPQRVTVIGFGKREHYLKTVDILIAGTNIDELTGDLWRKASSFQLNTEKERFLIAHLDERSPADHRAAFVAHSFCNMYLSLWKSPEKGGRPLPPWMEVGIVLMVDMRMIGHGGFYAIAYGKQQSKDYYRDNPKREDWLKHWKKDKKRADLDEAFDTPFSRYTHEHRMQAWMACESLEHFTRRSKRGYLPAMVEMIKSGMSWEDALDEVTNWNRKRFKSRIEEWAKKQKAKSSR